MPSGYPVDPEVLEQAKQLEAKGWSRNRIEAELKISHQTLVKHLGKLDRGPDVPVSGLAEVIGRELPRYVDKYSNQHDENAGLNAMAEEIGRTTGRRADTLARRLWAIRKGMESHPGGGMRPKTTVTFAIADAILTGLDLPHSGLLPTPELLLTDGETREWADLQELYWRTEKLTKAA